MSPPRPQRNSMRQDGVKQTLEQSGKAWPTSKPPQIASPHAGKRFAGAARLPLATWKGLTRPAQGGGAGRTGAYLHLFYPDATTLRRGTRITPMGVRRWHGCPSFLGKHFLSAQ